VVWVSGEGTLVAPIYIRCVVASTFKLIWWMVVARTRQSHKRVKERGNHRYVCPAHTRTRTELGFICGINPVVALPCARAFFIPLLTQFVSDPRMQNLTETPKYANTLRDLTTLDVYV